MRLLREESGQVMPLMALGLMTVLIGMVGAVVDVASWYRAQRHMQAVADAAALAAAQVLPSSQEDAAALASDYAARNGGEIDPPTFPSPNRISVTARASAPSYFTRVLGFDGITVHASATAAADSVSEIANVVPLAVSADTAELHCGAPCFGQPATLTFSRLDGAGGAFGLMDFTNSSGNVNPGELADWIREGFPGTLTVGEYESAPGNRYNSAQVRAALEALAAAHETVLVPVYSGVEGNGENARYTLTGFGAFRVDDVDTSGGTTQMSGSFERVIEHGAAGQGAEYYGVSTVGLVG